MATRVVMPSFGMYTAEGSVASWLATPGSQVEAGQPIVELSTDKTSFELESPAAGRFHPVAELGAVLQVEGLIALVLEPGEAPPVAAQAAPSADPPPAAEPPPLADPLPFQLRRRPGAEAPERAPVSPLARRLAEELGVDLAAVAGSGPNGRIVEADVRAAWSATREPRR